MYITTFHWTSRKDEYDFPGMGCTDLEVQKSQRMGWVEKKGGRHKLNIWKGKLFFVLMRYCCIEFIKNF